MDLRAQRLPGISSPASTATRPTSTMSACTKIFASCAVLFASSRASIFSCVCERRVTQGGGLGIATCALNSELINRAAILYPFLSDFRLVWDLDADDIAYEGLRYWSRWFDEDSTRIDEAYAKLAYFDSKNFAMVKCPVLFGTGTKADIVCPPATQFAVYNNLTCEKRHEFFERLWPRGDSGF